MSVNYKCTTCGCEWSQSSGKPQVCPSCKGHGIQYERHVPGVLNPPEARAAAAAEQPRFNFRCHVCQHTWVSGERSDACPACTDDRNIEYHDARWGTPVPWLPSVPPKLPIDTKPAIDKDVRPDYYGGPDNPYEAIKVFEAWYGPAVYRAWLKITVVKYLMRGGKKAGEDEMKELKKAYFYLGEMLASLERQREKQMEARRAVLADYEKEKK